MYLSTCNYTLNTTFKMLRPITSSLAFVVKKKKSFILRNSKAGFSSSQQLIKMATKKLKANFQISTNQRKNPPHPDYKG